MLCVIKSRFLKRISVAAIAILVAPMAQAAGISGTFTGTCFQQDARPLEGPNHVLMSQLCKGTNSNPGGPMDGADVVISQIVELNNGNGPQTGQNSQIDKNGSMTTEYHGAIKTVVVDGQPRTTGSGTYRWLIGTGAYKGVTGHGTYDLTFTSKTDFVAHWRGEMASPRRQASR